MYLCLKGFETMIILDELRVEMTGYRKEMAELADVLNIEAAKKFGLNGYIFDGDAKKLEKYLDSIL